MNEREALPVQAADWVRRMLAESGISLGVRVGGGLAVGAVDQPPASGSLILNGAIRASSALTARVYRSNDQSIPSNTTTVITFDTVRFDGEGMWSAAQPTRLTCPVSGLYLISGHLAFAQNSTGRRMLTLRVNDNLLVAGQSAPGFSTSGHNTLLSAAALWMLQEGDFVELLAYQSSGAGLAVKSLPAYSPELSLARIA